MQSSQRLGAEAFGTFWLVLGGCGTAVLAAEWMGALGVSLAFGLTVLTGRFDKRDVAPYIGAQLVGAALAGGVLFVIASGVDGFSANTGEAGELRHQRLR